MDWAYLLAYVTGMVNEELLLRNEYLAAENRILKAQLKGRVLLSDTERMTLAEIGHRLGRKALEEVAQVVRYDIAMVSEINRPEIRWFESPSSSRTASRRQGNSRFDPPHGQREYRLGL